ncbi:OB-fold nucleic acid binding domain-containing protein [Tranquillimonas rosea]|uniref:OB-fold nucleic acid binding domain-containing protein n=1 Tax=Tranquillimonas rosea TaxID=641238 RepID=UPI003BACEF68
MTDFGTPPAEWPRPPACLPHARLDEPPQGARVAVAGLVLVRQRPGTAKGVIFITLEDETGICNVIVWRSLYERYRRAVIAGRCLRVTGRLQREGAVVHVVADVIEDISWMLDDLLRPDAAPQEADPATAVHLPARAADQP